MSFLKKWFGKKEKDIPPPEKEFNEEEFLRDYDQKAKGLEDVLGKMHEMVGHAIISFAVGGAVDMYYFPNHINGTGFATMELLDPEGNGPKRNRLGTYELVAFTRLPYDSRKGDGIQTAFERIERRFCGIFTMIAIYSSQAILNPGETCELPGGEKEEKKYILFDNYIPDGKEFKISERKHHLLLCLEVFKSELEFSRTNGSASLLELLKSKNYYPYSDLDREPVA
jgi:hypothetical protein